MIVTQYIPLFRLVMRLITLKEKEIFRAILKHRLLFSYRKDTGNQYLSECTITVSSYVCSVA